MTVGIGVLARWALTLALSRRERGPEVGAPLPDERSARRL